MLPKMANLESAIKTARLEDLQKFPETKRLEYEGYSYLRVVFGRKA